VGDTSGRLASHRILIVDDSREVRDVLDGALTEAGARVFTAENAHEALGLLPRHRPELVLLDLYMPGMDGWQFIERLPNAGLDPLPAIVLQTSADDYGSVQRARRVGVAAYVSKPFRLNEVVETCRRVLEGARPLQGQRRDTRTPTVIVPSANGGVVAHGTLVELADDGAQVDLNVSLPLGQKFRFVVDPAPPAQRDFQAEVRWVRSVQGRWIHGLRVYRP
jgi:CheY-like chemotaxis protein